MLDSLPEIWEFIQGLIIRYWNVIMASSVLAGFLALAVLDRLFGIFDILKR